MSDPQQTREMLRISCADALGLMGSHLEQDLSSSDSLRLRAHLSGCEACAVYLDQLALTIEVVCSIRGSDSYAVSSEVMEELLDAFRESG